MASEIDRLVKRLDDKTRKIVFDRDGYQCVLCGSTEALQWSHLISRTKTAVRWDPINSTCMCARCHYRHHKQGPEEYTAWFLQTYGDDAYLDLVRRSKQPIKRLTFVKQKAEEIL